MAEQDKIDILGNPTFSPSGAPDGRGIPSKLYIGVQDNKVKFSCKIDGNYQNVKFPSSEFAMLLQMVRKAAAQKEEFKETITVTVGKGDGQRIAGALTVGRDADGIVFIAFGLPNHPASRFNLLPNRSYKFVDASGTELPRSELSRRKALAWCDEISAFARIELARDWDKDKDRFNNQNGGFNKGGSGSGFRPQGGGQGGGFNRGGNNGGGNGGSGYNQAATNQNDVMVNFDEFIP